MTKLRVGITGNNGFLGRHLSGAIAVDPELELVDFRREYFDSPGDMRQFLSRCDRVVHLAGESRNADGEKLYNVNMKLAESLVEAAAGLADPPAIYLGSTTHIARDLPYHRSKRDVQKSFEASEMCSVTMLMPNIFGPYSRPYFNSVVSTFCYMASRKECPSEINDVTLELIYVGTLCRRIKRLLKADPEQKTMTFEAEHRISLPALYEQLLKFANGDLPDGGSVWQLQLWETFRSYQA